MPVTVMHKLLDKVKHPRQSLLHRKNSSESQQMAQYQLPVSPRSSSHNRSSHHENNEDRSPKKTSTSSRQYSRSHSSPSLPNSPPQSPVRLSFRKSSGHERAPLSNTSESSIPERKEKESAELSLQDFKLLRTLGTGSFGRVHLAQSKHNKRYYAIKVLKKAEIVRLKQVEHTNSERAVLMDVQCPFIVNLWGTFQDSQNLFMVMDYVAGGELFSVLRKCKRFTEDAARFYAGEVLLALAYLHSHDIIYRDLKPENILLDSRGHIKMTDFGFAKKVRRNTWTMCGTPDYLAPEVIESKGYGKSVDYWSLGVLIYEMLAGHAPFYDESQFRLYEKILTTEPQYPSHFSSEVKDLLRHLLTTDLTKRYGNLKRGYKDIMDHRWFAPLDFDKLSKCEIDAPYVPHISGGGDTSNFLKYKEGSLKYGGSGDDPYHEQFEAF
ncbi:kinase-like domain-containing protein [Radiomyces spectabilis]|uniref:kinase-like domain-containing protein n=1 Tax=Radiomyces spectabilis TaxID=64574 RepID=UPI00221E7759|nr:kinase-like domain-containing protein [Radiomyces spectabilis]KAI8372862.1 kinase-like domain-containing protein [Radiomyces spectabilis]